MAPVASRPVEEDLSSLPVVEDPLLPANDSVAHAMAGAGGGMLSTVVTYPLIALSTRAQVESRRAESSFLAAVQGIVAREGVAGLYAGLTTAVFGIGLTNFVYYFWYEWTRELFVAAAKHRHGGQARSSGQLSALESMVAGAIAGSATVVLTNPIWVVNTRMTTGRGTDEAKAEAREEEEAAAAAAAAAAVAQTEKTAANVTDGSIVLVENEAGAGTAAKEADPKTAPPRQPHHHHTSTIGTLLALLRDEGPQALFAGVVPALVLVANPILQYTLFEQLKNALQRRQRRRLGPGSGRAAGISPAAAFVLGAVSKLFATGITYPYITIKSRMHVAATARGGKGKDAAHPHGVTAELRRVVRDEGYAGLYKGIGPKITQSVLTAAFLFALKDVLYTQTLRLRARTKA